MNTPSARKLSEWRERAALKEAIVPHFFEVFPTRVIIICGSCQYRFIRNLVPNVNEPTFVCPNQQCRSKNWVPVRYQRQN